MTKEETSAQQRSGRVKDARGRSISLLDPYALLLLRRYDVIEAEALEKLVRDIGPGWSTAERSGFLIFCGIPFTVLAGAAVLNWSRGWPFRTSDRIIWIVEVAALAVGVCIIWWWARRKRLKRTCAVLLRHLRCPHCGYDLRLLPVDPPDGATVCPECGCAWRLASEPKARSADHSEP